MPLSIQHPAPHSKFFDVVSPVRLE